MGGVARGILKNWNLIVDGRGYAGNLESYDPPALTLSTEEFRGGGMDGPIDLDMGMEKLTTSFTLTGYSKDVLVLWGVEPGNGVQVTARGATEDATDGRVHVEVHRMRGTITGMTQGQWKAGGAASLEVTMSLTYYRHESDGVEVHEIDVINMIRRVAGKDRLAAQRKAIGL